MNIRLIATEIGDALKYDTSINEINRIAKAIFPFRYDRFPNDSITSQRAQLIYDWIMSLGRHECTPSERIKLLISFTEALAVTESSRECVTQILKRNKVETTTPETALLSKFDSYEFHSEVYKHCRTLYGQGNFFHAVFEATKVYHNLVKEKSLCEKDGESMMLNVWDPRSGVLKITPCITETDRNVQDGIKFLSAGLMRAIRNPTAHEPALDWPINQQDATDILSFLSFLLRNYEKAVRVPPHP